MSERDFEHLSGAVEGVVDGGLDLRIGDEPRVEELSYQPSESPVKTADLVYG